MKITKPKTKKEIISQKALIIKDSRFLTLLRTKEEKAFPGLWDFPGGKMEAGENFHESLKREVKEETNLVIKPRKVLGIYHSKSGTSGRPVKFIIYASDVISGEIKLSQEHKKYQWLTTEEIEKLPTMPFMNDFLTDFKNNKK